MSIQSLDIKSMKVTNVRVREIEAGSRQKSAHVYFFSDKSSLFAGKQFTGKNLKELLPTVFGKTKWAQAWKKGQIKASWSHLTGCQCGCSPGFRLQGLGGVNIFADVA